MLSYSKSIKLTTALLILVFAALLIAAFFLPQVVRYYYPLETRDGTIFALMCINTYALLITGLFAVVRLYLLLDNIKKEQIFVTMNTIHLKMLSYSCFAACLMLFCFGLIKPTRPLSLLTGLVAFFLGLILRILRFVFAKAVELREESDTVI